MIATRLIAATYVGGGHYRWLVRAPNFATNHDLRIRLWLEHALSAALSYDEGPKAGPVREARIRNYWSTDAQLVGCCPTDPL